MINFIKKQLNNVFILINILLLLNINTCYGIEIYDEVSSNEINLTNDVNITNEVIVNNELKGVSVEKSNKSTEEVYEFERPIAIMVENEPPARPQSGLYAAKVLFEIQAEEVTRFMPIYYDYTQNFEIGPIRSARHYFVDIALMFDAIYVHVGGSPMGLSEIKERKVNNIDAIKGDRGFYRSTDRKIPHNLYAKLPNLKKEIERKQYRSKTNQNIPFDFYEKSLLSHELNNVGVSGVAIKKVEIPYSKGYRVSYEFNENENTLIRFYNNKIFKDYRNQNIVKTNNLILMRCNMYIIDKAMRHDMDLYEGGTCEIFIGNHFIIGTWDRDRITNKFKFYDSNLNLVKFNPGNIFIHIIPPSQKVIVDNNTYVYDDLKNNRKKISKLKEENYTENEVDDETKPPF